jgi:uroporphyrinogen-III synthase
LHQSGQLAQLLREQGAEPIELPLIRICPPDSWTDFDNAFQDLSKFECLLFASANAVDSTVERTKQTAVFDQIKHTRIACIGKATANSLKEHDLSVSIIPDEFIAESLIAKFPVFENGNNKILWPRTNIGRNTIKDGLEDKGWKVTIVQSYQTLGPENPLAAAEQLKILLSSKQLYAITIASSETCNRLKELLKIIATCSTAEMDSLFSIVRLAAIGPETAKACLKYFGRVDIVASEHSGAGLVQAIKEASD